MQYQLLGITTVLVLVALSVLRAIRALEEIRDELKKIREKRNGNMRTKEQESNPNETDT